MTNAVDVVSEKWFDRHRGCRRVLYTLCFILFCLIDQRIHTGTGLDGIIESFRFLTGFGIEVLILSHYRLADLKRNRIAYIVWGILGLAAGVAVFEPMQKIFYFKNARAVWLIVVYLFGFIAIHTFIDILVEKNRPVLNKRLLLLWTVMLLLMIFSVSDLLWPLAYFLLFGVFYLTDFTPEEQTDMTLGAMDGVIIAFILFQGFCCVFRPYDEIRYPGIYSNCNINARFYLIVFAALCGRILWMRQHEKKGQRFWYVILYLGIGVVYCFMFMTIGRTGWLVSFLMGLLFLAMEAHVAGKKLVFLKKGLLIVASVLFTFPFTFGFTRYLPPAFHHPIWFYGEWAQSKVHSWDKWDSEKFIDLDELLAEVLGRLETTKKNYQDLETGFMPKLYLVVSAAELTAGENEEAVLEQTVDHRAENAVLTYEEAKNGFIVRKTIYQQYIKRLNLVGHRSGTEYQGFQLTPTYWIGHAHNLYLQWATDFGVPAGMLLIIILIYTLYLLIGKYLNHSDGSEPAYIFWLLAVMLFGMLEYCWGPGSITILLMFMAIGSAGRLPVKIIK